MIFRHYAGAVVYITPELAIAQLEKIGEIGRRLNPEFDPGGSAPCVDEQLVVFPGDCGGDCIDLSKL